MPQARRRAARRQSAAARGSSRARAAKPQASFVSSRTVASDDQAVIWLAAAACRRAQRSRSWRRRAAPSASPAMMSRATRCVSWARASSKVGGSWPGGPRPGSHASRTAVLTGVSVYLPLLQREGGVGEFRHHVVAGETAEIAARAAPGSVEYFLGEGGEIGALVELGDDRLGLGLGLDQDVAGVDLLLWRLVLAAASDSAPSACRRSPPPSAAERHRPPGSRGPR